MRVECSLVTSDSTTPGKELPAWGDLAPDDVLAACAAAGKSADAWCSEFLPAMAAVVDRIEAILRAAPDREDTRDFRAENILSIRDGIIYVRIFTCVNGWCHVPAEGLLALGVHSVRQLGWPNLQFDFSRPERPTS